MRIATWFTPVALLGLFAAAQGDEKIDVGDLPKAVTKAVKEKFPEAKIKGASKEVEDGKTFFEVELSVDGKSVDVVLEPDGDIEAIEKEIEVEDLPKAVIKAIAAKFSKAKIEKVEEITGDDDKVVYELAIAVKGKTIEVVFSPNGKIIEDEDDDKGEAKGNKEKADDKSKAKKSDKDDDDDKGEKKEKPKS